MRPSDISPLMIRHSIWSEREKEKEKEKERKARDSPCIITGAGVKVRGWPGGGCVQRIVVVGVLYIAR